MKEINKNRQALLNDINSTNLDTSSDGAEQFIKFYRENAGLSTPA